MSPDHSNPNTMPYGSVPVHARTRPANERHAGRVLFGLTAGAICGFITYWGGATLVAMSDLVAMPPDQVPHEFMRPFQTFTYWELVVVGIGAILGAIVGRYRWGGAGLLAYVGLVSMIGGYVVYALTVAMPQVPEDQRWLSYILLAAETTGLGLIVVFSFYSLDAATRMRWGRTASRLPFDPTYHPTVALMVPAFNEPPEMVEQTLLHLLDQDYPKEKLVVVLADDSTDAETRARLAAFCARSGAVYQRRPTREGFKAGAINYASERLPPEVEFISIIDADYWVAPEYVRSVVGYFMDTSLAWVQTPQDYRNVPESFLTKRYKDAEAYFYHAIMPSRNEHNAIIFCGTMGMIRRAALEDVGGFAEDQICEDAEISVRLAVHGWRSLYDARSFGKGLMPAVFDAYKKQFYRWAFGNVKMFFTHWWTILRSRMTKRQKYDYLASNLHWFDGFAMLTISFVLLYLGLGPVLGYDAVTHHQREVQLVGLIPFVLLVDSVMRLHLVLSRSGKFRVRDTFLVLGVWFAIKMTTMTAVARCMMGFKTPFVRTPKHPGHRLGRFHSFFRAIRLTKLETTMGTALIAVAALNVHHAHMMGKGLIHMLLSGWLVLYALFFLCAPIYAYLSYRTLKPMNYDAMKIAGPDGAANGTVWFEELHAADDAKGGWTPASRPRPVSGAGRGNAPTHGAPRNARRHRGRGRPA